MPRFAKAVRLLVVPVTAVGLAAVPVAVAAPSTGSLDPSSLGTGAASSGSENTTDPVGSLGPTAQGSTSDPSTGSLGSMDVRTDTGSSLSSGSVYPAPMTPGIGTGTLGSVLGTAIAATGGSFQLTDEAPGSLDIGVGSVRVNLLTGAGTLVGYAAAYFTSLQNRVDAGEPLPPFAMTVFAFSPNVAEYQRQALAFHAGTGPFPTAMTTTDQLTALQETENGTTTTPATTSSAPASTSAPADTAPHGPAAVPVTPMPAGSGPTAPIADPAGPATIASSEVPALAATGTDTATTAAAALALLASGAALVAVGHRRTS